MRTQAIEDYLKAIYELHEESGAATTSALANRLGVAPASATMMVKKLASLKLVAHKPYRGVVLCKPGERIALEVIRHHRLVESFLAEVLGVPWDEVHDEAERWEHVLSEELEERIDERLGFPTSEPARRSDSGARSSLISFVAGVRRRSRLAPGTHAPGHRGTAPREVLVARLGKVVSRGAKPFSSLQEPRSMIRPRPTSVGNLSGRA